MQYWGLSVILVLLLGASTNVQAQDNVTIDMGVLEEIEDYQPPPMFSEERIQLKPLEALQQFPVDVQIQENTRNPAAAPSPVPVASYSPLTPPLPPRRPQILKAPISFVQDVRKEVNLEPMIVAEPIKEPEGLPAPPRDAMDITEDPLMQSLSEPSAQELLQTIEGEQLTPPAEAPAPEPAQIIATDILQQPEDPDPQDDVLAMAFGPDISKPIRKQRDAEFDDDVKLVSLAFPLGIVDLDDERQRILQATALTLLNRDPDLKIQIQAFARPNDDGQSSARRLSLARAINLRAYLIEQNIDPTRIDLRALGDQTDTTPIDRVDLILLDRSKVL